jgi:serine phosphatase RsbU (regulator of sigma subunit)
MSDSQGPHDSEALSSAAADEQEKRVRDLESLLEVVKALAAEKDLDKLLELIIEQTTQVMDAERSSLYLYDEERNEIWTKIAQGVVSREIRLPVGTGISGTVAQTLEPINIPDAYADARFDRAWDQSTGFRTHSILCMPMRTHEGKLIGVIQVLNKRSGSFTDYDEELLGAFSTHAAIALDSARLIQAYLEKQKLEQSLEIARQIQQGLFPEADPEVAGFQVAGRSWPCDRTGGDYYDYLQFPDGNLGVVVADVTGHGIGPALLMSEARAVVRALASQTSSVAEVLERANNFLAEDFEPSRFVTMFLGRLEAESASLRYSSAGHGEPMFYQAASGEFLEPESTGPPLAVIAEMDFPEGPTLRLEPGDILVVTTDGIEEAMNADREQFGRERLQKVIADRCQASASELLEAIYDETVRFMGSAPRRDDITLVVVKAEGQAKARAGAGMGGGDGS